MTHFNRETLRRTILATTIAGLLPITSAMAATITVNTFSDVIDPIDNACSLREAVIAANSNTTSGDTSAHPNECVAGEADPAVDVINLPAGTYPLTIAPEPDDTITGAPTTYVYGEYTATWNSGGGGTLRGSKSSPSEITTFPT